MYHGHFINGVQDGEGTLIYTNKDVYSGELCKFTTEVR